MTNGESSQYNLVIRGTSSTFGESLKAVRRNIDFLDVSFKPHAMRRSQVCDNRKEGDVLSVLFRQLLGGMSWGIVHGGVDRNDNVRIVCCNSFPNLLLAHDTRMYFCEHGIGGRIGKMIKKSPLKWVRREVLVGFDQGAVRVYTIESPNIEQIVRATGKLSLKLQNRDIII